MKDSAQAAARRSLFYDRFCAPRALPVRKDLRIVDVVTIVRGRSHALNCLTERTGSKSRRDTLDKNDSFVPRSRTRIIHSGR